MKYFIDTEFIEGFKKPLLGKRRHFIDLISIGIVAEDGREYYAVSNEFNPKDADEWVKENVLLPLEIEFYKNEGSYAKTYHHESLVLKNFLKWKGKSNKRIAEEITQFIFNDVYKNFIGNEQEFHARTKEYGWNTDTQIEFFGYYADYDWVLFCSLFGRMIDLPKGYPMYCQDLKQMFEESIESVIGDWRQHAFLSQPTYEQAKVYLKSIEPKQKNEHNALSDAKWNYELYKFINKL